MRLLPLLCAALLYAQATLAEPPAGVAPDSATAMWFKSLHDQHDNLCCSVADCRPVMWRSTNLGRVEVFIGPAFPAAPNAWIEVPPAAILHRTDNPMGDAVACYYNREVRCFVWGTGT